MSQVVNIERLRAKLADLYNPGEINQWLRSPQPLLGGETPEQFILAGHLDQVEAMVDRLLDGVFI